VERFRLATEVLAGFVFDWDVLTNHLEWFGDLADVLGCRADEMVPDFGWYQSRVHPDDLPGANERVQAAFESGAAAYSNVYRFRHPDGHYVDVADRGRIIRDATGQAIRVLGGVSDISDRRRFERERDQLLEREREARVAAEAAIRGRDEILGVVSHDLRNPLGAIALCAGALLETIDPSAEEERRILQAIEHAAASTNRLIRDLLDVANIEGGHLAVDLHVEAPGALLAETGEIFVAAAQQRGLTLETQADPDLPAIRADAGRVHQALANLVTNALKFTHPGGRITLRSEQDLGCVRFAVEDTGVGIPADDLPHVFDRYWQKRRSGGEAGVGLGLAIVRGIVDAHGGHLAVESTPGKGSQFSFTIPTAT
jgi:PAS domain S-box-containing protein